jgi:hypothetical protein
VIGFFGNIIPNTASVAVGVRFSRTNAAWRVLDCYQTSIITVSVGIGGSFLDHTSGETTLKFATPELKFVVQSLNYPFSRTTTLFFRKTFKFTLS